MSRPGGTVLRRNGSRALSATPCPHLHPARGPAPDPRTGAVMPIAPSARVHPTAVVSPEADVGEGADVGPHVVIEGEVRVGAGSVLRPGCCLIGPLTMGRHNTVYSGAVLGERPQHVKYNGEPTRLEI